MIIRELKTTTNNSNDVLATSNSLLTRQSLHCLPVVTTTLLVSSHFGRRV